MVGCLDGLSMLKYLDVARFLGAGIQCPQCNGTHCRQSRWHSKHERLGFDGFRPFRCEDCSNRFLAPQGASRERIMINASAYIGLAVFLLAAAEVWLSNADEAETVPVAVQAVPPLAVAANASAPPASTGEVKSAPVADEYLLPAAKKPAEDVSRNLAILRKSASEGHVGAMVELAQLLAQSEPSSKEFAEAVHWTQMAASTGHVDGMYRLGRIYRDGLGMKQDPVRAYVWLNRAANAKHVEAARERDVLVRTMSEEQLRDAHNQALSTDRLAERSASK
jgi:uncharacterized protein